MHVILFILSLIFFCMQKLGRKDTDLKALPTFEAIETYLKERNESFLSHCFG